MMRMQSLLAAVTAVILVSGGASYAATVTVDGSYTVSYAKTDGNGPAISDDLSHPFAESLTVGTSTTAANFFTATPNGSCGYGCVNNTASGIVTVTFSFSNLTVASGSLSETGTYDAKYSGSDLACSGKSGSGQTDCIDWGNTNTASGKITDVITFTNGDVLDITLNNAEDWSITPMINFEISQTPLPATLPLFAGGLGFVGYLAKRRKKNAGQALPAV